MNEIFLAQKVIRLERLLQTDGSPQRKRDTHEKILGALQRLSLCVAEQILELLQRLEPEIVKEMVAFVADLLVDRVAVTAAQIDELLRDRAGVLPRFLHHLVRKSLHHIREAVRGVLVMVRDGESRGKRSIISMGRHQRDGELRGKFVELRGFHSVMDTKQRSLRNQCGIHFEARGGRLNPIQYLVKGDILAVPISLDHLHTNGCHVSGRVRRTHVSLFQSDSSDRQHGRSIFRKPFIEARCATILGSVQ